MKKFRSGMAGKLLLTTVFLVSLSSLVLMRSLFSVSYPEPDAVRLRESVSLTERWMDVVKNEKAKRGIVSDAVSNVPYACMLGNDYTEITTTLGSLEAKELSTNPEFAAVFTKMLMSENIGKGSVVGLSISGSFPSLEIAMLAALQTLGAEVVLFSSLGASSYGANQPGATWIDMENWLINSGGLGYRTKLLTYGAENDNGGGLSDEGMAVIEKAAADNGHRLYVPASLEESIHTKIEILRRAGICLYINIGGSQASMGACPHAVTIPNGLNKAYKICGDSDRGILSRMSESGVDFIHILNIRDLAYKNGIPLDPGSAYGKASEVYSHKAESKPAAVMLFILITVLLLLYRKYFRLSV